MDSSWEGLPGEIQREAWELGLIDAQMSGATVIDVEGKSTSPD